MSKGPGVRGARERKPAEQREGGYEEQEKDTRWADQSPEEGLYKPIEKAGLCTEDRRASKGAQAGREKSRSSAQLHHFNE